VRKFFHAHNDGMQQIAIGTVVMQQLGVVLVQEGIKVTEAVALAAGFDKIDWSGGCGGRVGSKDGLPCLHRQALVDEVLNVPVVVVVPVGLSVLALFEFAHVGG